MYIRLQERRAGAEAATSEVSTRAPGGVCAPGPPPPPPPAAAGLPLPRLPQDRSGSGAVASADAAPSQRACSGAGAAQPPQSGAPHTGAAAVAARLEPTAFLRGANAGLTGHSSASGGSGASAEATVTLQQAPRLGTPATGACALSPVYPHNAMRMVAPRISRGALSVFPHGCAACLVGRRDARGGSYPVAFQWAP